MNEMVGFLIPHRATNNQPARKIEMWKELIYAHLSPSLSDKMDFEGFCLHRRNYVLYLLSRCILRS